VCVCDVCISIQTFTFAPLKIYWLHCETDTLINSVLTLCANGFQPLFHYVYVGSLLSGLH